MTTCSLCDGQLELLGQLGKLPWFRCRRCGIECVPNVPTRDRLRGEELLQVLYDGKRKLTEEEGEELQDLIEATDSDPAAAMNAHIQGAVDRMVDELRRGPRPDQSSD